LTEEFPFARFGNDDVEWAATREDRHGKAELIFAPRLPRFARA